MYSLSIAIKKTNDYLKKLAALAEIKKPLTFHCGRHIFATVITLSNGVPIETVSKALDIGYQNYTGLCKSIG